MNLRLALVFKVSLLIALAVGQTSCRRADDTANMTELQRVKSGEMDVVLLSSHEALRKGKDAFTIEFRSTSGGRLINAGMVRMTANMPMPGMPMFGTIEVQPTNVPGRYTASSDIEMAGTWRMNIEWDGPAGRGAVSYAGTVQ